MSNLKNIQKLFDNSDPVKKILNALKDSTTPISKKFYFKSLIGSALSFVINTVFNKKPNNHFIIFNSKQEAGFCYKDLQEIVGRESVLFFPESYTQPYKYETTQNANILMRNQVLKGLNEEKKIIVSYSKALAEKVISKQDFNNQIIKINKQRPIEYDDLINSLHNYHFETVNFVSQPGEFSIRGGIIDIFSFGSDNPYRIEYVDDNINSIRIFDVVSQESIELKEQVNIISNSNKNYDYKKTLFKLLFNYKQDVEPIIWIENLEIITQHIQDFFEIAKNNYNDKKEVSEITFTPPEKLFSDEKQFLETINTAPFVVEFGNFLKKETPQIINFNQESQPLFKKHFPTLIKNIQMLKKKEYQMYFFTSNIKQAHRLEEILISETNNSSTIDSIISILHPIHNGFIDHQLKIACYTDHQIFDRIQYFRLKEKFNTSQQNLSVKDLNVLSVGDYVTHIDYGIGKFSGLQKINNNGKIQEAVRLEYANNDLLYVNIHALHKISKYTGKEGTSPSINKLKSERWKKIKKRTQTGIKTIAFDLIKLYAKRKAAKGYKFTPDSYLQNELEASFMYEDTPDQAEVTKIVKKDMEAPYPMDRLICGDVGFGKTEIAIRAAFKAVDDSKQVVVLVPTTILALQHYKTFISRIENLPCTVNYINRFKTKKQQTEILKKLADGKIDIIIGTHRIMGKDVKFKDLGLLIIDEEHKFGVGVKDKLKTLKANLDTLSLTATPIPRTLQFSLIGARDLSNITTPPPNKLPVQTEIINFNESKIRDIIIKEIEREGQIFFVNNRIENCKEIAGLIQRLCPEVRIKIAHGQIKGEELEQIMLEFIEYKYDILISTTIIESGLDIPNANTIIINQAHHFGLSDLHQMRGRVGRANKRAYCYLIAPDLNSINEKQRKRLKTLVEFSDVGSGFNIALKDLDIRGAGNLLGPEQSGFMNEMGVNTYQKILAETINELKLTEFKNLYKETKIETKCQIETDLEAYIPDSFITESKERLRVYEHINNIKNDEKTFEYKKHLEDRFGKIPKQLDTLFEVIKLKQAADILKLEKLKYTSQSLKLYFISNSNHIYFNSTVFKNVLEKINQQPPTYNFLLTQHNNALVLNVTSIKDTNEALKCLYFLIN